MYKRNRVHCAQLSFLLLLAQPADSNPGVPRSRESFLRNRASSNRSYQARVWHTPLDSRRSSLCATLIAGPSEPSLRATTVNSLQRYSSQSQATFHKAGRCASSSLENETLVGSTLHNERGDAKQAAGMRCGRKIEDTPKGNNNRTSIFSPFVFFPSPCFVFLHDLRNSVGATRSVRRRAIPSFPNEIGPAADDFKTRVPTPPSQHTHAGVVQLLRNEPASGSAFGEQPGRRVSSAVGEERDSRAARAPTNGPRSPGVAMGSKGVGGEPQELGLSLGPRVLCAPARADDRHLRMRFGEGCQRWTADRCADSYVSGSRRPPLCAVVLGPVCTGAGASWSPVPFASAAGRRHRRPQRSSGAGDFFVAFCRFAFESRVFGPAASQVDDARQGAPYKNGSYLGLARLRLC